jgi:hypothetical protein
MTAAERQRRHRLGLTSPAKLTEREQIEQLTEVLGEAREAMKRTSETLKGALWLIQNLKEENAGLQSRLHSRA